MIVDVHAHALVPEVPVPVDLDARLAAMDATGVDVQAVAVAPAQYRYGADRRHAAEHVCAVNEGLAALVRRAPDRLVGICSVALQHPDLAAEQLRRAVDDYDFRGVQVAPGTGGRDLTHPAFDPLWTMAAALGIVVFVRPPGCGPAPRLDAALDRFPDLVVCAAPGEGEHRAGRYVDAPVRSPAALRRLVDAAGAGRVLLGSDYPFAKGTGPLPSLLHALAPAERAAVGGGTARTLLRLT